MVFNSDLSRKSLPELSNPAETTDVLTGVQYIDGDGEKKSGAMTNNGAVSESLNAGESFTIPEGYHDGSGKVSANSLASQTSGTATASEIVSGYIAWVNGVKVTGIGTMAKYRACTIEKSGYFKVAYTGEDGFVYELSAYGSFSFTALIGSIVLYKHSSSDTFPSVSGMTRNTSASNGMGFSIYEVDA